VTEADGVLIRVVGDMPMSVYAIREAFDRIRIIGLRLQRMTDTHYGQDSSTRPLLLLRQVCIKTQVNF
jgi:hypothetical protein